MFRHIIAATLLATASLPAQAADDLTTDDFCKWVWDRASFFMSARQLEVPITQVMSSLAEDQSLERAMVVEAFDRPAFSTQARRVEAARAFGNEWAARCYSDTLLR